MKKENKAGSGHSRRLAFLSITIVSATALFFLAYLVFRMNLLMNDDEERKRDYSRYYAMICDDHRSSFWQRAYTGAKAAAEGKDACVELFGSNLIFDYTVAELMEMAISSEVDGIMVLGSDKEELTELIDRAAACGIPVVTMYSDNPDSRRCSFVGVSEYNIGREYGRQILNALGEKNDISITVLFDNGNQMYDHNLIISGINDVLAGEGNGKRFTTGSVQVDDASPFSVEESIRDIFMTGEIPDAMVCLSELDTTCAYQAVIDHNLVGSVYILGYHDSEKILNAINRNVVYSTLAVDAAELGRYSVEALDEYIEMGITNQYFATDVNIIDRQNINDYLNTGEVLHE